ncbi:hypothetical protein DMH04_55620 [Kibdelosporangium aridum]|uniref:Uncharacterized protein n=1 Tax=Kibdelosporangium aridum TaxID=2030 RepID=A0A428XWH3_KIBAR|nr:hypothetical protein [Kibdelosporangium aridum]RSM59624.1 hypothetical protein DMH04_55620 [Kibdelosporangium aridum]
MRTAYDDEEIFIVVRLIGAKLRRREDPDRPTEARAGLPSAAASSPADVFFQEQSRLTGRSAAELAADSVQRHACSQGEEKTHG